METNKIYHGDSLEVLKTFPNESIDCVMTSPPYWALRSYNVDGQLGLEPTFQEYITKLCDIFDEVKRVLKKEGTCWVNLGDTYYGSGKGVGGDIEKSKQSYVLPQDWKRPSRNAFNNRGINKQCLYCKTEIVTGTNGQFCNKTCLNKMGNNFRSQNRILPDKTLCQIPSRFAIEMTNRGWTLRNKIIWHKPNCMPCSVKDRFTVDFEEIFFFVKSKKYYFETQYEPVKQVSIDRAKYGWNCERANNNNGINIDTMGKRFVNIKGRNKRTTWSICPKPFKEAHFATYPETLCETPLKSGCPIGGIILDPFFGAGTTGLVALKQNKKFIGIELNEKYIDIANARLKPYLEQKKLF
jgi:site-specific DNA-methyltransferase (adenine-specific)